MIRPIEPVIPRIARSTTRTAGRDQGGASGAAVPRAEAATVVQLSDYATARRESQDQEAAARQPSWTDAVIEMVHEAARATCAVIVRRPLLAEAAQARVHRDLVLDLTTG